MIYNILRPALQLLFYSSLANSLPPAKAPPSTNINVGSTNLNMIHSSNGTAFSVPEKVLTSFPPGPPSNPFFYTIPGSEIILEFSPLGFIPKRNESLVSRVLLDALLTSLDYRVSAKMPGHGYQAQEQNFIVGVTHAVGKQELTWGMWTMILNGMTGYVQAYPGYDFLFEIRLTEAEELASHVIGAGFAITRG